MSANKLWLVIGCSLAINLLLIGVLLGGILQRPPHPPHPDHRPPHMPPLMRMFQALPSTTQEKVRPLLDKYEPELKNKADALHSTRHEVRQLLLLDPLNKIQFDQALLESQRATSEFQLSFHRALGEIATQLSMEERKILAESLLSNKRP